MQGTGSGVINLLFFVVVVVVVVVVCFFSVFFWGGGGRLFHMATKSWCGTGVTARGVGQSARVWLHEKQLG